MPADSGYVIVGASLAGAKAAETLREEGFDGRGRADRRRAAAALRAAAAVQGLPARRRRGRLGVRARRGLVRRAPRWTCGWASPPRPSTGPRTRSGCPTASAWATTKLLLATGASPRRLDVPGADLDGVLLPAHASTTPRRCATRSTGGGRVVIVGAGWIGLETAAAARKYGCEVTVVEPEPSALHRSVGPELGAVFAKLHASHGVTFRFGERRARAGGAGGQVSGVLTSGGAELPADVVVVAIGAAPNTRWPRAPGLEVDNGVVVDAALRTSRPGRLRRRRRGQRRPIRCSAAGSGSSTGPTR